MIAACGLVGLPAMAQAGADGTETLGPPSVQLAEGSGFALGGVGIQTQPVSFTVTVPEGATVRQVLLYYETGHHNPTAPGDQVDHSILIDGIRVEGQHIGGPSLFYGDVKTSTHRVDITDLGLVGAGTTTLTADGLDSDEINDGVGVVVVYDLPGHPAQLRLVDGNDIAFANFAPPKDTTVPQTFTFDPAPVDRVAHLSLMVTSIHDPVPDNMPNPSGDPTHRPHALTYTVGGVTTRLADPLVDEGGREFDLETFDVTIPAGASSLTAQLLSEYDATGDLPASLVWLNASLAVPVVAAPAPTTSTTVEPALPPTTAPPAVTPTTVTSPPTTAPTVVAADRAALPFTGTSSTTPLAAMGFVLLTAGSAAVLAARRRRSATTTSH
jgi:LPXTG-motif cell wall-anchored protein